MLMKRDKSTIPVDEDWETGDGIDWRYRWNIINRRKWSIIGLALAVGLLTTLVVFAMTPIYRASATLLIESQAANVVSIEEVYGLDTRRQRRRGTRQGLYREHARGACRGDQVRHRMDGDTGREPAQGIAGLGSDPAGVSGTGADRRRDRAQGIACRGDQQSFLPAAGTAT